MYQYKAKVVRVVDGDTIDVDIDLGFHIITRQRLRLLGVDTPEVRGEEREEGLKYKAMVIGMLPEGASVIVVTEKQGKYGRYLADVYIPGQGIGGKELFLNDYLREMLDPDGLDAGI